MLNLKELDNQVGILSLIRGDEDGKNSWVYLSFYPSKMEEYEKAVIAGHDIDLTNFGIIIESGLGDEPPEDIRKYMEQKYQFNHSFIEK